MEFSGIRERISPVRIAPVEPYATYRITSFDLGQLVVNFFMI